MKFVAPLAAALLWITAGCGASRAPDPSTSGEVRHPSNEMIPLKKPAEPEHPKQAAVRPPPPKPHREPAFEDPRQIPAGIEYRDMVRRFGPPSMRVNDGPARTTFSYSKLKTQVQVEVQNGKVVSVTSIDTGL